MPTLDDLRTQAEKNLAKLLDRLDARHRKAVKAAIKHYGRVQDIPEIFWLEMEFEIEQEQVAAIALLILAADEWTSDEIDRQGVRAGTQDRNAVTRSARDQVHRTAAATVDTLRKRLARKVEDATVSGPGDVGELTDVGLDDAIDSVFTQERRSTIATDSTTTAFSTGQRTAAERAGRDGIRNEDGQRVTLELIWRTELDNLTCSRCRPLEGKTEDVWGQVFPNGPGPEAHPNCILPGQLACVPGFMPAATNSFYVGWCVEILCRSGRRLAVTEDHLILTGRGYHRAADVVKGDDVFTSSDPERIATLVDPDNDHCPALIEEIFRAAVMAGSVSPSDMPITSVDFNGNSRTLVGQVDVVNASGQLRSNSQTVFRKHVFRDHFNRRAVAEPLSCFGSQQFLASRVRSAATCGVCGCDLPSTLPLIHRGPLDQFSGRLATRLDTHSDEATAKSTPGNASHFSQDVFGFSSDVSVGESSHFGNINPQRPSNQSLGLQVRPKHNTESLKGRTTGGATDTKLAGKFLRRFSSMVTTDEVVRVRRFKFSGQVYDLQCDQWGLLFCNGVIIHNCRCSLQPQVVVESAVRESVDVGTDEAESVGTDVGTRRNDVGKPDLSPILEAVEAVAFDFDGVLKAIRDIPPTPAPIIQVTEQHFDPQPILEAIEAIPQPEPPHDPLPAIRAIYEQATEAQAERDRQLLEAIRSQPNIEALFAKYEPDPYDDTHTHDMLQWVARLAQPKPEPEPYDDSETRGLLKQILAELTKPAPEPPAPQPELKPDKREWNFQVVRDDDKLITSIRAVQD
jgi:hypothetical protein